MRVVQIEKDTFVNIDLIRSIAVNPFNQDMWAIDVHFKDGDTVKIRNNFYILKAFKFREDALAFLNSSVITTLGKD